MHRTQVLRRGVLAMTVAGVLLAGFTGGAGADGGLIGLVAHGAQDVYLTPSGPQGVNPDVNTKVVLESGTAEILQPEDAYPEPAP